MKIGRIKHILLMLLSPIVGITIHNASGTPKSSKGKLKDAEFVIEKERKLHLPEASRLFKSAPSPPQGIAAPAPPQHTPPVITLPWALLPLKTKILRTQQDVVTQLYGNYVRAGHGNFYTPYLEGYFDNKRNPKYAYGLHLKHLSSGNKGYAEESHSMIQLHGRRFMARHWFGTTLHYSLDSYQIHTPAKEKKAKQQLIHQFSLAPTLTKYTDDRWDYEIQGGIHHIRDQHQARESQVALHGVGGYALSNTFALRTQTDLYLTKYTDSKAVNRHLYRLKPMLHFTMGDFTAQGGVNLVYQNDVSQVINSFNTHPIVEAAYALKPWLRPYVGLGGDVQPTSWQSFMQENPLLAPHQTLCHTHQRFVFYGGAKGDLLKQIAFHAGLAFGKYQQLPCFVNNAIHSGRFDIQYDPEATLSHLFGELTYTLLTEKMTTKLRGDYFGYQLKKLPQPWHRPQYQLDLSGTYRLYDKVVFNGNLCWLGGLLARDPATATAQRLKDVLDLGLGIDYWWTKRLSFFCHCQNILARRNQRYLHTSTRGIQFLLGLAYTW